MQAASPHGRRGDVGERETVDLCGLPEAQAVSLNRHAKRKDGNHARIVAALRRAGAYVVVTDTPCDAWAGFRGRWTALEFKRDDGPPSRRRLTAEEFAFATACGVDRLPFAIVRNEDEALAAIGATGGEPWTRIRGE